MSKIKNYIVLVSFFIFLSIVFVIIIHFNFIDVDQILYLKNDFHYNIITLSATIGGFLFTGISILISILDKDRIRRLWDNNYLDNLYRFAFIGLSAYAMNVIIAFALLCNDFSNNSAQLQDLEKNLIYIELLTFWFGFGSFVFCSRYLLIIIKKLKPQN